LSLDAHPRLFVASRDFHLAHTSWVVSVGSWAAVEPNGTGLPSTTSPPGLGAVPPSPRRALRGRQRQSL